MTQATLRCLPSGGAGPLHVCAYGRDVGARAIVVPSNASVFSAFGIAGADVVTIAQASDPMIAPFDLDRLNAHYSELEAAALADVEADGVAAADVTLVREIEMRYRGQVHEIRVPLPAATLGPAQLEELMAAFETRYTRRYGRGTVHTQAGIEARTYAVRESDASRRRRSRSSRSAPPMSAGPDRRARGLLPRGVGLHAHIGLSLGEAQARSCGERSGGDRGRHHECPGAAGVHGTSGRHDEPDARDAIVR